MLIFCVYIYIYVGSRFLDQAHYNEFVESGSENWALIRRRLVLRGEKCTGSDSPRSQGEGTPRLRTRILSSSRIPGASLLFLGLLLPGPPFLWDLCCYISYSSILLLPTLVGHPCPYSSARPIGHFFWRSVSCCGPHCTVQGSHLLPWD